MRRWRLAIACMPIVVSWVLVAQMVDTRRSILAGRSAEFWEATCGVQLDAFGSYRLYAKWADVYPPFDGSLYYVVQEHHGEWLYRLRPAEAARDLVEVRRRLSSEPPPCDLNDDTVRSIEDIRRCDLQREGAVKRDVCRAVFAEPSDAGEDVTALVERVRTSSLSNGHAFEMSGRRPDADAAVRVRVQQANRAWVTGIFEAVFLASWWLFVAWPWITRAPFARWVVHAVAAPFVLFVPFFLGYAPMTFTWGPSGGYLYPLYLWVAALPMSVVPCSGIDGAVWPYLPRVFAWLTQLPGEPMAWSNFACVGPVSSLIFGALVGAVMVVGSAALVGGRRWLGRPAS